MLYILNRSSISIYSMSIQRERKKGSVQLLLSLVLSAHTRTLLPIIIIIALPL